MMFLRSTRQRLVALAVFLFASLAFAAPAFAQATIAVANETSLPRLDKNGNQISKRPVTLKPEAVNYQDCIDDQQIQFTLLMSGFEANASVQVWAATSGTDCGAQLNRASANKLCWQVAPNVPLQQQVDVRVPVREIMSGVNPPFSPTEPNATITACGQVPLANVSVQFLYFKPGDLATAATNKQVQVEINTVGPPPPTGITALPGNTRIQVSWTNIAGEGGLTALTGVSVYCDPAPSGATTVTDAAAVCTEAGTAVGDADAEIDGAVVCTDAGSTAATCSSQNFVTITDGGVTKPVTPSAAFDSKFKCGALTGNTGTTAVASSVAGQPLQNGTQYAVAVAGTDAWGNIGPLSTPVCQTPEETTDFWANYKDAGGEAGGGFCSTTPGPGVPAASFGVLAITLVALVSAVRRRLKGHR